MKSWRRPKKEMMLAVNALLDGDEKLADKLIAEHRLDRKELQNRLKIRNGIRYIFERRPKRGSISPVPADEIISRLDGRTKIVTLLRLAQKIEQLLEAKPKDEVAKVRQAIDEYEKKRVELKEMEALLGL